MQEEKFWLLLSLKLSGEATLEELEALDSFLLENPQWGMQVEMLSQVWKENKRQENNTDLFFNRHLQRLSNYPDDSKGQIHIRQPALYPEEVRTEKEKRFKWLWLTSYAAAASLLIFFIVFYKWENNADKKKEQVIAQNTVSTRRGSKSKIQLPDGTMVWLNADSKVIYDENFRGNFREVHLEGEAFFDVVKDKTRPFIIHTKTIDIKVLGTAFNVRAYETEKNTETALFRGSVEVTLHNNPEKRIVLKPNEKLLVNNKTPALIVNGNKRKEKPGVAEASITITNIHFEDKDSSALETLWIKNKLVFDAESLEQVAQKIERWYDAKVIINGDELKHAEYSGIFDNESIEQVMEALHITGNFKYKVVKNVVTIW
ncbi:FecR family protein [Agriterribacter humi]|uniref:FecR family protein n=1 Tax=Agriterribacter humi TaxID=1104781 RepID=UPI0012647E3C|nr:FecR family protein [Agriterribacter humi]